MVEITFAEDGEAGSIGLALQFVGGFGEVELPNFSLAKGLVEGEIVLEVAELSGEQGVSPRGEL